MNITKLDPSKTKISHTPRDRPITGIDTLPDHIVSDNLKLLAKFKLLKLLVLLKDGPTGQQLLNLPDSVKVDMSTAQYRLITLQNGTTWPSRRNRAIRAFMGSLPDAAI